MNFKWLLFLVLGTVWCIAFPSRSPEDIAIQDALTAQINMDVNNPDLRFDLAIEYAATGWVELGWDQLQLVSTLNENYKDIAHERSLAAIQSDPTNWKEHFKMGFIYYFKDDIDRSFQSFHRVISLKPDHEWSYGFIALLYGVQKKFDDCITWSKKGLNINNDATAIHFLLGRAYYERRNFLGVMSETLSVARLKSVEAKYRPIPPKGIQIDVSLDSESSSGDQ